jgi:DNA-3-methyladenine glycosylase
MGRRKLDRVFYEGATISVAKELIGKHLIHRSREGIVSGRIVETEAYVGLEDRASHASRGKTPRNAVMFGPAGFAYIYLIYGMHHCLNMVTESNGFPSAVLIRAVEPVQGMQLMRRRRGVLKDRLLGNGPGKVCQAFGIDRALNGADLCGTELFVEDRGAFPYELVAARRVGVDYAGACRDLPWRFLAKDHPCVSTLKGLLEEVEI